MFKVQSPFHSKQRVLKYVYFKQTNIFQVISIQGPMSRLTFFFVIYIYSHNHIFISGGSRWWYLRALISGSGWRRSPNGAGLYDAAAGLYEGLPGLLQSDFTNDYQ